MKTIKTYNNANYFERKNAPLMNGFDTRVKHVESFKEFQNRLTDNFWLRYLQKLGISYIGIYYEVKHNEDVYLDSKNLEKSLLSISEYINKKLQYYYKEDIYRDLIKQGLLKEILRDAEILSKEGMKEFAKNSGIDMNAGTKTKRTKI